MKKNELQNMPKIQNGDVVDFKCRDLGERGEGIGTVSDNRVCFADGVLPGESASVKIIYQKKKYLTGKPVSFKDTAAFRQKPVCEFFDKCGGCQIMHANYNFQLSHKYQKTYDALKRIAKIDFESVSPVVPSGAVTGYRNRMIMPLSGSSKNARIGFYKRGTHDIVDIGRCPVCPPGHEKIIKTARDLIEKLKVSIYQDEKKAGMVKHLVLRYSDYEKKFAVTVITADIKDVKVKAFAQGLSLLENVKGVALHLNSKKGNAVFQPEGDLLPLFGDSLLREEVNGLMTVMSPLSFFQLNRGQSQKLYQYVLGLIASSRPLVKTVAEFYSGSGVLTALLVKSGYHVNALEISKSAVNDARMTARENGIDDYQITEGDVVEKGEKLLNTGQVVDCVILNPPRGGIQKDFLLLIVKYKIPKMIYISCKPSTLARDIKILIESGYILKSVQPFDMLPQTTHIENVAELYLKI